MKLGDGTQVYSINDHMKLILHHGYQPPSWILNQRIKRKNQIGLFLGTALLGFSVGFLLTWLVRL